MSKVNEYDRLCKQLDWVKTRIKKVKYIMDIPEQHLESMTIRAFRERMLVELTQRQLQLEKELDELVDDISLEDSNIYEFICGCSP